MIALALLLLLTQPSGQERRDTPRAQGQAQPRAAQQVVPQPRRPDTVIYKQAQEPVQRACEDYPQDAGQADLCVQTRMANTADSALVLAEDQLFWTRFEVFGLVVTVVLTFIAVAQTRQSLHTDRAWLTGLGFTAVTIEGGEIETSLVWKNTGRSPALDVRIFGGCRAIPKGESIAFSVKGFDGLRLGVVGPDTQTPKTPLGRFSYEQVKDARAGKVQLIAHGTVTYRDIYSKRVVHRTEFTTEVLIEMGNEDELRNPGFMNTHDRITMAGWSNHNAAT